MNHAALPPMITPSSGSTALFLLICLAIVAAFVCAVYRGARLSGGDHPVRWAVSAAGFVVIWLSITGAVSGSGMLLKQSIPPPLMLFFVTSIGVSIGIAFSPFAKRIIQGTTLGGLVAFQAFRLPLELVLHRWYEQGVIPIQMTFSGHNFDILSGCTATAIALWTRLGKPRRWAIIAANALGFTLLLTVGTIAVLSSPVPFRQYHTDPPLLLAAYFPYGWIVPICVGGALCAHLLTFRALKKPEHQ